MPKNLAKKRFPFLRVAGQSQTAFSRQCRGQPSRHEASPRPSQEATDDARQRLIDSTEYSELVSRVDGRSPFAEQGDGGAGDGEEKRPVRRFARTALRVAVDVSIVLVPVAIGVSTGVVPAPVVETCKSVAVAIGKSPIDQVGGSSFLGFVKPNSCSRVCAHACVRACSMCFRSFSFFQTQWISSSLALEAFI